MAVMVEEVLQCLPGRVRLKIGGMKGNAPLAAEVERAFSALPGMQRVEASPVTGKVLMIYDVGRIASWESLWSEGKKRGLFPIEGPFPKPPSGLESSSVPAEGSPSRLAQRLQSLFDQWDAWLSRKSGGWVDLKVLIPLTLFWLGLRSLLRSQRIVWPAWYNYFWFAFSTFRSFHPSGRKEPADSSRPQNP